MIRPTWCVLCALMGCGGPLLSVTVQGGGHVEADYVTPGDGVDCLFCPQTTSTKVIDCDETGGPFCSGTVPSGRALTVSVEPSPGFRLEKQTCPAFMPSTDTACTVTFQSCAEACPDCSEPPAIDSLPATTVCSGKSAHLTGSGLSSSACVTVNGSPASAVTGTDPAIDVVIPFTVDGPLHLVLVTSKGSASTDAFTALSEPALKAATPASGSTGTTLTLTGSDLNGATVTFDPFDESTGLPSLPATVTSSSSTQLTVTVPAAAAPHTKYVVWVSTMCGDDGRGGQFTFTVQ
jgi:hypothetical protein